MKTPTLALIGLTAVVSLTAGCSRSPTMVKSSALTGGTDATAVNLGYLPNVTQIGAVLGVSRGTFAAATGATITPQVFNAGPLEVTALLAGALDVAYMGPSSAITAFTQSNGAVRIIAGATTGGASLIVKPSITSIADLAGKTIADPQLGNTQDVALKTYLSKNNLTGKVTVQSQTNSTTLTMFKAGGIDGAWVPEPYASELVLNDGGSQLVDERTLWPGGHLLTTVLVVRSAFETAHPDSVKKLIQGQLTVDKAISADKAAASTDFNTVSQKLGSGALASPVLTRAVGQIAVGEDPYASTLQTSLNNAVTAGTAKAASLKGILDLRLLNQVLGRTVDAAGLGVS